MKYEQPVKINKYQYRELTVRTNIKFFHHYLNTKNQHGNSLHGEWEKNLPDMYLSISSLVLNQTREKSHVKNSFTDGERKSLIIQYFVNILFS